MKMVETKVTAASVMSLVVSCVIAVLNAVSEDSGVLSGWPEWLQFIVLLVIPPVLTFLSGYQMPSSTSRVSEYFDEQDNV